MSRVYGKIIKCANLFVILFWFLRTVIVNTQFKWCFLHTIFFIELNQNKTRHVCVIGAGYSGLGTARHLKQNGVEFTVYEATRHIGGTWRFDPHVGTDEDGLPLFTSMYKYLRTNTPRQTMEYPGFPFPDSTPSFPTGTCFYKYLKSFAKHYDLNKYIQFRSFVTSVKWANGHWNLTYRSTVDNNTYTASCDFVVVANGFYSNPKLPHFPGQELFKGTIIHSHDYKEPEVYKDRRVLILGAGPSGLDLATHLVNFTSKLVHSHHLVYNQPNFPKNYIKKPDIDSFTTNGVVFNDGSFEEVDDIIFCTGYNYNHPFLDKSSGVTVTREFLLPLYQDVINIRHPSMAFVGKSKGVINRIIDVQSEYAAALAAEKFKLPRPEEMLRIWLDRVHALQAQKKKIVDVNLIGKDMYNYCANLTQEAGVTRFPPVIQEIRDFNLMNRLEDLLNYRDHDFEIINEKQFNRYYNPGRQDVCPVSV